MIIKFNLIPRKEKPDKEIPTERPIFLTILVSTVILLASVAILLTWKTEKEVNRLNKNKKEKEELLVKYKNIANKVKEIEKRNEETEKRIKIIVSLKEKQSQTLRKIATIIHYTEPNRVFFNNFYMNDTNAKIKGISIDIDLLANYMNNLDLKKDIIKSINLKSAESKKIGVTSLFEFELEVSF